MNIFIIKLIYLYYFNIINFNDTLILKVNGPYLMLIPFRTVKESIDLLNNSKYGSGVSIHSQDISLGFEIIQLFYCKQKYLLTFWN